MAGGRGIAGGGGGRPHPLRSFSSYRVFASAVLTLLLLASLSLLFSSSSSPPPSPPQNPNPNPNSDPLLLALRSDPHLTRLHLLRRQASDHLALVRAYSSFALRLKLSSSHNLHSFLNLSLSLSDLVRRLPLPPLDEDALRPFEKDLKDKVKIARLLVSQSKESFDTQLKIQKLRDTIFAVSEHLSKAKKLVHLSSSIAASSTPKSLHCLNMRLMEHLISNPSSIPRRRPFQFSADDPNLLHFAVFSDNVLAVSVVINSAIKNADHPANLVFHVITDKMYLPAMQVWFARRPPAGGATVDLRSVAEFPFLNSTYSPLIRQAERPAMNNLPVLDYLRFYLPEMFPELKRIVLLEDDVVVQKDLAGLWKVDLDGKVNAAVEMCFGGFRRYSKYMNFSNPEVRERFSPRTCAWGFGVNVFDLDAWRREQCTDNFHRYMSLNEDGTLWKTGSVLPAGLMTFYTLTKPLDKSWHVMGLGYNPSVSQDEIRNAAVVHFNGDMKPWLDVAMNQYKHLWTKYVDTEMEYLPLCNFGL